MQFTPLKDFEDKDLRSVYCVGLSYTARPGDALLLSKIPEWVEAGMVRAGAPDQKDIDAHFAGSGEVK